MTLAPGMRVRDVHNAGRLGTITNAPPRQRSAGPMWQVRWDAATPSYEYESGLEVVDSDLDRDPYDLVREGKYGRAEQLRRNLTFVHLTGRLANLVYSIGITNTDFYAHQYRPLLTFLESPASGILIADEVGLGKTIEAGLIWTEYRARYDKRRLLIVCPAMLREKWRVELETRFGVRAQVVGAAELLSELQNAHTTTRHESAWIISYQSARPPRAWTPASESDDAERSATWALADFLHERADSRDLLDLVIFDEAHYMRNRETGAWRLGELLRGVSEYQVMLSATPINLKTEDLFSLLHLLDREHFASLEDLDRLLEANRPLVVARDLALNVSKSAAEYREALERVREDPLLSQSAQLERLLAHPPTEEQFRDHRYRAELAEALERLNLLSHVLTRTRKRDVQARRIERRVVREAVHMSAVERDFYEAVTAAIRQYAQDRNVADGFLLATPQRQVSSSPAALLRMWQQEQEEDSETQLDPVYDLTLRDSRPNGFGPLRSYLQSTIPRHVQLHELEQSDSKLGRLQRLLRELFDRNPSEKVIIFTAFRATARYLAERLRATGIAATIVWGQQDVPKHEVIREFERNSSQRVLISTEVAAEGVDLQFCRTVINYDLPWNPTRIEQRIGRVDRLGQRSDQVFVWNLYFADTIDDRIVTRLLARLRVFEEALGESESVVGEVVAQLEYQLLTRPRTAEEEAALIENAALRLETVARQRRELEENAPHMMAHGQRVLERIEAAQQLSRRVTELDLFTFVQDCLRQYWPGHEFVAASDAPMQVQLRLPGELLAEWGPYLRERGALGQTRLATGNRYSVVFRNAITQQFDGEREVVHQFHPLIGFLSMDLKRRTDRFFPVVAVQLETREVPDGVRRGVYVFSVWQWAFTGVQEEEWLMSAVIGVEDGVLIEEEAADLLVQTARVKGRDWLSADQDVEGEMVARALEAADLSVEKRYEQMRERKRAENADRGRFQLDSLERHEQRTLQTLDMVEQQLRREKRRESLVKATQGRRRALLEQMNNHRARIRARLDVAGTNSFVCGGIIRVHSDSA